MAVAALCVWADFAILFKTTRMGPSSWGTPVAIYRGDTETVARCSAGTENPYDHLGIVIGDTSSSAVLNGQMYFIENGLPFTRLNISSGAFSAFDCWDYWDMSQGAFWRSADSSYWVFPHDIPDSGNYRTGAFQTTDDGTTWTEYDSANAPVALNNGAQMGIRRTGDKVDVLHQTTAVGGKTYALNTFDFSTKTWSGDSATFTVAAGARLDPGNGVIRFANGDVGVFYTYLDASVVVWRVLSGGTWSAETTVATSDMTLGSVLFANCILDPDGSTVHHFFYYTPEPKTPVYQTITHSGTLTSSIYVFPRDSGTRAGTDGIGNLLIDSGTLFVPYDFQSENFNSVWTMPLSSPGTFTKEPLPIPTELLSAICEWGYGSLGTGYALNDTGTINLPGTAATYIVTGVSGGHVNSIELTSLGSGAVVGSTYSTTATTGGGSGLTISITAITLPSCAYMIPAPATRANNYVSSGNTSIFQGSSVTQG